MDLAVAMNKILKFLMKKGANDEVMAAFGEIRNFITEIIGLSMRTK